MGQLKPVTVTRFCVTGTIEEDLFSHIDSAAVAAKKGCCDNYVIADFNDKAPAAPKREEANGNKSHEGEEDEVNDIQVTGTLSPNEQLRRKFQSAQENADVISLDDDNDNTAAASPSTNGEEEEHVEDDDDVNDVKVTDIVSPNERIRRKFQKAHENGEVLLCLDPDDDKEDRDPTVKVEPMIGGKRPPQDADLREAKQMKTEQQYETNQAADPEATTSVNDTPAPHGSSIASVSSGSSAGITPDRNQGIVSGFTAVRDLLWRLGLSEYAPNFLEKGFDDLDWLCRFAQDPVALENLSSSVGFKPGHAVRFQFGLIKEAFTQTSAASAGADLESNWI
jgi:hypothetical protein